MKPQRNTGAYLALHVAFILPAIACFSYYLAVYAGEQQRYSDESGTAWVLFAVIFAVISIICAAAAAKQIGDTIDYRHDLLVDEYEGIYGTPDSDS